MNTKHMNAMYIITATVIVAIITVTLLTHTYTHHHNRYHIIICVIIIIAIYIQCVPTIYLNMGCYIASIQFLTNLLIHPPSLSLSTANIQLCTTLARRLALWTLDPLHGREGAKTKQQVLRVLQSAGILWKRAFPSIESHTGMYRIQVVVAGVVVTKEAFSLYWLCHWFWLIGNWFGLSSTVGNCLGPSSTVTASTTTTSM